MVISLTSEQEARIVQAASEGGLTPETFATELILRGLDWETPDFSYRDDPEFIASVQRGSAQAEAGEFVPEAEMEARWQRYLRPQ